MHSKWLAVNQFQVGTTINDSYGARQVLRWLFTGQIYDWKRLPIVTVFVGIGLVVCVMRWGYDERGRGLVGAWLLSLFLFFGRPTLGPLLNLLPGNQSLLLQRYIMGVHLAGLVLAGVGMVATAVFLSRQLSRRAHRARNPIMAHVTGRLPSLQGICSTTAPCSLHSTRRGA